MPENATTSDHHLSFVDIHCHLLPGLDDGAPTWDESLQMASMAAADGTDTIVATPHQLGMYPRNDGNSIRHLTEELAVRLRYSGVPLTVLPGADVRIEADLPQRIAAGEVLTLADKGRHVLLELPHELYFPIDSLLKRLQAMGVTGILTHPERNLGLMENPTIWEALVDDGCLMQVTCGSLLGAFGAKSQQVAEAMLRRGCVHFLASDGHGSKSRRPRMAAAFDRLADLIDLPTAQLLCCENPRQAIQGHEVSPGRMKVAIPSGRSWFTFGRH